MSLNDSRFLEQHVAPKGYVVNLGIHYGFSLYRFCRIYGHKRVVGIDTFQWKDFKDEKAKETRGFPSLDLVSSYMKSYNYFPTIIQGSSLSPPDWLDDVGCLFVDTNHTGVHLRKEMDVWIPRLRHDAIVMFHDYKNFYDHEYPQTIDQIFGSWNKLGEIDQMVAFSR